MWKLYRREFYHIMCMVRSLLFLSIYCAVFTVSLFCFGVCFVFVFLFVHCTFVGSCAVVNVR